MIKKSVLFLTMSMLAGMSLNADDQAQNVDSTPDSAVSDASQARINDSQIQTTLQTNLKMQYGGYKVSAHVFGGNVIITGVVNSDQDKQNIGNMVQGTPGVKKVTNQLIVRQKAAPQRMANGTRGLSDR